MSDDLTKVYESNREHAKNAKQKFNYFFVGLTFSVLALAMKFGVQTDAIIPHISEFIGCSFLLISGILGAFQLAEESTFFSFAADIQKHEILKRVAEDRKKAGLRYQSPKGEPIHPDEAIQHYETQIESKQQFFDKKKSISNYKYRAQKWCFGTGVILLFLSYAYPKISLIFQHWS